MTKRRERSEFVVRGGKVPGELTPPPPRVMDAPPPPPGGSVIKPDRYECGACGYRSPYYARVERHMDSEHRGGRIVMWPLAR